MNAVQRDQMGYSKLCRLVFEDYREGMGFEHDLINRKITWLLTSQTILFAALGLSLRTPVLGFVLVVGVTGLSVSLAIMFGLRGNFKAKRQVWRDYVEHPCSAEDRAWGKRGTGVTEFGVRTRLTENGIKADAAIPVLFASAWIAVIALAPWIVDTATELASPAL